LSAFAVALKTQLEGSDAALQAGRSCNAVAGDNAVNSWGYSHATAFQNELDEGATPVAVSNPDLPVASPVPDSSVPDTSVPDRTSESLQAVTSAEEDCYVDENVTGEMTITTGNAIVIQCEENGSVTVYEDLLLQPADVSTGGTWYTLSGWPHPSQSGTVTSWNRSSCTFISEMMDGVGLPLTQLGFYVTWGWTGGRIVNIENAGQGSWARTTENSSVAFGDWYMTSHRVIWGDPVMSATGRWASEWIDPANFFSFDSETTGVHSGYSHKHRVRFKVTREGECDAYMRFQGSIPPGARVVLYGPQVTRLASH